MATKNDYDVNVDVLTDPNAALAPLEPRAANFHSQAAGKGEALLLETASSIAGEWEFSRLADRLGQTILNLPRIHVGGLGVYDEQRDVFTAYVAAAPPDRRDLAAAPCQLHEFAAQDSEVAMLRTLRGTYLSTDLAVERPVRFQERLHEAGARRYISVPMFLRNQLLGTLFAGSAEVGPFAPETISFLESLARLTTPVLWNCLAHQFFTKGDSRRDTLIELSNAINTSLELDTVIRSTHQAVSRLEGYRFSAIELLSDGGHTFVSHRPEGSADGAAPERVAVASRTLEWIVKNRRTYQSADLASQIQFDNDAELKVLGVRRYVAAPLFTRGNILGAFLFGSAGEHPLRKVDVWLYENIALQLGLAIDNAMQHERVHKLSERLALENVYLREEIQIEQCFSGMIGLSPAMQRLKESIARVAGTQTAVLITGETGVGKELVARAIHAAGPCADRSMVKVNCAAIPEGMVESELFGHERGAFTSAVQRRIGRFELAADSTLFLDEIGELSPAVQAKLLHVLQDGEFQRVGGSEPLVSNARIIAATNRDLAKAVENGAFRSDLYYRLNVFPIDVPRLDQRREDIPLLVEAFMAHFSRTMGKPIEGMAPASLEYLCARDWPGNIRELRHVIERAVILSDSPILTVTQTHPEVHAPSPAPARPGLSTLKTVEAEHILRALDRAGHVIEGPHGAAATLGLKPSTLRFRMKRLGIARHHVRR